MGKQNSFATKFNSPEVEPIVRLWLLRLLVPMGLAKECFTEGQRYRRVDEDHINSLAALFDTENRWFTETKDKLYPEKALEDLMRLHKLAEKNLGEASVPKVLAGNVKHLSKLAGLSRTDCRILEFAVLLDTDDVLKATTDALDQLSITKFYRALSAILHLPEADIRSSVNKKGGLSNSGLVTVDRDWRDKHELEEWLTPIASDFADAMLSADADPLTLLRSVVFPSAPACLNMDDFSHKAKEMGVLLPYLKQSLAEQRPGVNILLYGAPGTGKTQLARILAREAGCKLFEVASADEQGDPLNDVRRVRAFHAAQALLSGQKLLILFDEIEDVFHSGVSYKLDLDFGYGETTRHSKAWFNQRLEQNRTPTLWVTNSLHNIHSALMRRFDMVIEMPVPPRRQRRKILRENCRELLSEQDVERIAAAETLAPAVVTRAGSVVTAIKDNLAQPERAPAVELIINNTLEAQGYRRIPREDQNQLPAVYDPTFIHTDADIESVAAGLHQASTARLCLYGPSGTGKTAYGRWLAQQLDVPLLVKRGSDLMSKWVGGTEKNIAACFQEAETEAAILLIDEVEGFLHDRRAAQRSWEVTGVNEMLTQMESFPGVFIASTNLLNSLDQAALRRFDMKIKFDYLLPRQTGALLARYCKLLSLDPPGQAHGARLARLRNLTPGDFAVVARRHRFKPVDSATAMVTALEEECNLKENTNRPIGFY